MNTSPIFHPPARPLLVLREEYVRLCGGDHCQAALLAIFEYWTMIRLAQRQQWDIEAAGDAEAGHDPPPTGSDWIWKTPDRLSEDMLGLYSARAVSDALAALGQAGLLRKMTQKGRMSGYSLDVAAINAQLAAWYPLPGITGDTSAKLQTPLCKIADPTTLYKEITKERVRARDDRDQDHPGKLVVVSASPPSSVGGQPGLDGKPVPPAVPHWPSGRPKPGEHQQLEYAVRGLVELFYALNGQAVRNGRPFRRDQDLLAPLVMQHGSAWWEQCIRYHKHPDRDTDPATAPSTNGQWPGLRRMCASIEYLVEKAYPKYCAMLAAASRPVVDHPAAPSPAPDWRPQTGAQFQATDGRWGQVKQVGGGLLVLWEDGHRTPVMNLTELGKLGRVVEGVGEAGVRERVMEVVASALPMRTGERGSGPKAATGRIWWGG